MSHRARPVRTAFVRLVLGMLCAMFLIGIAIGEVPLHAQGSPSSQQTLVPGRNVNMVSGTQWPTGDPYLQRQNEPSIAASTRNPLHLLAGANDYRTVDVPFVSGAQETGDAWLGVFKSFDGGQRWQSTLMPGYPQDVSAEGQRSPLYGYQAGADPVVRAGTNGLFYFAGLVFDREEKGKNAVFVARFIDDNNKEAKFREGGYESRNEPVRYLGASLVASSAGTVFYDKPWMAVDIPRAGAKGCMIPAAAPGGKVQSILAGNVYVAFTAFTEDAQGMKSAIYLSLSDDCGRTWTKPALISQPSDRVNQGVTIAIAPRNGTVYAGWRRFAPPSSALGDGFVVAKSTNLGRRFSPPAVAWALARGKGKKTGLQVERLFERWRSKMNGTTAEAVGQEVNQFDQGTSDINGLLAFRTNMYPTMTVDGSGRVYMAWAERGFGQIRSGETDGDARIVITTSSDGTNWNSPFAVANENQAGHQIMPSLTFGGGKLVLVYYDLREDIAQLYGPWIDDASAAAARKRRTLDLRASYGTPGTPPSFAPSIRISDYLFALDSGGVPKQLQYNPPNLPMFKQGTAPFMGDYVDVTVAPAFVPTATGGWAYNINGPKPVFHAVWTDNRDVRQPSADLNGDGNPWNDYTAPTALTNRTESRFDPTQPLPNCNPLNTGSRNQNIYTARLTTGLVVGSPGNTKPLSPTLQRSFVVFAQNTTNSTKAFRLTIANPQLPGGRASFDQFNPAVTSVDVTTPYRSTAARTVYVTSSDPKAQVRVDVAEIAAAGGNVVSGGLSDAVILNPDIANPDIANPDIANPDIANPDIANAEVYNPDIANPDIANPDIANPDIANPDIANPDIANPDIANPDIANPDIANPDIANPDIANVQVANPDIANPDIANPDIANPDIANPDIANPDIANPDIANPDIANSSLTDVTWTMTNNGNTTAAFNVNLFLAQQTTKLCETGQNPDTADCIATQLILRKVYNTPTAVDCELKVESRNVLLANIKNPRFVTPTTGLLDQNDPSAENATLWLAPGETARITLRVYDPNRTDNIDPTDDRPETPTDPDHYVIDPIFLPTTTTSLGSVTPVVQQQSVDTEDVAAVPPGGAPPQPPLVTPLTETVPPAQTPTPLTLTYVAQPTTVLAGQVMTPAVQVEVRDQYGALLPNWDVTLFLASNPGNATLSGSVATTDLVGVATFSGVAISAAGAGFTLAATSGTALPAVSLPFEVTSPCNRLVVTTTADTGVCGSLRYALDHALPGETISFSIAGPTPHVFAPSAAYPQVPSNVTVDGTTDPDYAVGGGQPVIQISGENLALGSIGLALTGTGSTVRGVEFNGFAAGPGAYTAAGVLLAGTGSHTVQASHFGMLVPNYTGIHVVSDANTVGGTLPGQGNVVGGSGQDQGIWIQSGSNNVVAGNLVGNNGQNPLLIGVAPYSNAVGIRVSGGSTSTIVGGVAPGARNVVSGNALGILVEGGTGTTIAGNYVGLAANGTDAIANNEAITAYNSPTGTVIEANWIAGNAQWGIDIQRSAGQPAVSGTQIRLNTIGLNTAGVATPNGGGGIRLIQTEGTVVGAPGAGNIISGHANRRGVRVEGPSTVRPVIRGNYIGTDQSGTSARPNLEGISLDGPATIGGAAAGEGNLISGNGVPATFSGTGIGVLDGGDGSLIVGNVIGLGSTGAPLANGYSGITVFNGAANITIGGTAAGAGNVISGNTSHGIAIYQVGGVAPSNITIRGNTIGTDAAGTSARPNGGWGISISNATGVVVGDALSPASVANAGNRIASNTAGGVTRGPAAYNVSILSNSIYGNGALGIDVAPAGISGVAPILSNSLPGQVDFSLPGGAAVTYEYEIFANTACDPSGRGEGQTLVGKFAGGLSGTAFVIAPAGSFLTMTATSPAGDTTEFSNCVLVPAPAGNIASATPATIGAGQMIVLRGTGMPTSGAGGVLFTQGATTLPASYTWTAGSSLIIARSPGGLAVGPATVRTTDGLSTTPAFPITISATPGAPVLTALLNNCAAGTVTNVTSVTSGQQVYVLADGVDSSGTTFVWTSSGGTVLTTPSAFTTGGAGGGVCTATNAPNFAGGGSWTLQIRATVGANTSPLSNGIPVSVTGVSTITSVSPSATIAAGFGQSLTVLGVDLPAGGSTAGPFPREIEQQVVINQGGVDRPAGEVWLTPSATKWVVQLPTPGLVPGPATIRIRNATGTMTTNAYPIVISATPAAPVIQNVFSGAGGTTPVTSFVPGSTITVEADGIATSMYLATYVFTPASGIVRTSIANSAFTGSTGGFAHTVVVPGDLDVSSWVDLQVYVTVGGVPSAPSAAVRIGSAPSGSIFVPGTAGGTERALSPAPCPSCAGGGPGGTAPVNSGLSLALNEVVTVSAGGAVIYYGGGPGVGPDGAEVGRLENLVPADNWGAPTVSLLARVGGGGWQFVGSGPTQIVAYQAGTLEFAVNDSNYADNGGGWNVSVTRPALPNASVTLSGPFSFVYDGTAKSVGYATTPAGLGVNVTYNGGAPPTAIGAYLVRAKVTGGVYAGSAAVNLRIASTVATGGNGGGPFERYCSPDVFANGVGPLANSYYGLLGTQLRCSDGNHPARVAGPLNPYTGPAYVDTNVSCGPGEVMVGLHGQSGPAFGDPNFIVVANMGPSCQPVGGGATTNVPAAGGGSYAFAASPFSLSCPAGQAVIGVVGGIGEVVDSIALVCKAW